MMMAARPSQFTPTVSAIFSWKRRSFSKQRKLFVPRMRTWMDVIYDLWQCSPGRSSRWRCWGWRWGWGQRPGENLPWCSENSFFLTLTHSMPTQLKRVHCLGLKQLWSTDPTLSWDPQLHVSDWCFLGPVERVLQDEPPKQSCWLYQDFESCLLQWHVMFHEKMVE